VPTYQCCKLLRKNINLITCQASLNFSDWSPISLKLQKQMALCWVLLYCELLITISVAVRMPVSKTYRNERKTRSLHCDERFSSKHIVQTYRGSDVFLLVPFPFSSAGNVCSLLCCGFSSSLLNTTVTVDLYNVLLHGVKFVSLSVACEGGERTNRIIKCREIVNNDVFK
jgi:hypothetical protein